MLRKKFAILIFLFLTLILFRKIFWGLLPIPSAELVVGYFPWNAGGWQGFQEVIPFKAIVATDVFRQQFPWLNLSFDQVRQGKWPLWNPYNFSGIPHLANSQIHFFYPGNLLFFLLPQTTAWVVFVCLTPILSMFFMFLYTKKLSLSYPARIFTSMAFAFSSIMIFWLEWGFIAHGLIYLPLFLWLIEEILAKTKRWQFFAFIFLIFTELTSGYFPLTIYVFIFCFFYFLYRFLTAPRVKSFKKKVLILVFLATLSGILLSSIQLLPTLEAYRLSARQVEESKKIFTHYLLSPRHLITIFVHDFFGNFMTRNFWDRDYTEIVGWFGVVALIFAFLGIFLARHKLKKFYLASVILSLLFAFKNPVAFLPQILKIPILSSGLPSRSLLIFQFSMIVLGGMGLDRIMNYELRIMNLKKIFKVLIPIGLVYGGLWFFVLFGKRFLSGEEWGWRLQVSQRNLILPSFVFLGTAFSLVLLIKLKKLKKLFLGLIFCLACLEYFYFANKFLPFGPKEYIFPQHPLIEFLKENQELHRHYGIAEAKIDNNFATFLGLYSTEGFDSLYPQKYGEFLASASEGKKPKELLRSDALFPQRDTQQRRKAFNLLGVKYLLGRTDRKKPEGEIDFSKGEYELVWQQGNIQVFENKKVLPRAFLVGDYKVASSDNQILSLLFSDDFKTRESIILEEEITGFARKRLLESSAEIIDYQPNQVLLKTDSYEEALLFLSDTFDPGWRAYIDEKEKQIFRANYIFRAIRVPAGKHKIKFIYQPESFILGKRISFCVLLLISGSLVLLITRRILRER